MGAAKTRICPLEMAGSLDNRIRQWVQNPARILAPYVGQGDRVLDLGCGPGFFSVELARRVGDSGEVIAADVQEGMLRKLREKVRGTELENRIRLHRCGERTLGLSEQVDFALAFYVMHEAPDQQALLVELRSLLKPDGLVLIVEPPFHVSKSAFAETVTLARGAGFQSVGTPRIWFGRAALLKRTWRPGTGVSGDILS